jgi:hypothetical protein
MFRYLLECVEAGQNRPAYPGRVFSLWRSINLDLDIFEGELLDFVQEAVAKSYRVGVE